MDQETAVLEQEVKLPESARLTIIASKINHGLEAFEKRKAELNALNKECEGLTIASIDDKPAIEKVSGFRKKLKAERVTIEKEGKSMRDPLTQISRTISEKENELIAIIEPTEKLLLTKENWVRQEKDRIEVEKEKAEQAALQARVDKLAKYGYTFDLMLLKTMNDEHFENTLARARIEYEKELAAKVEEKRLADEAAAKLKADQEELALLRQKQADAQAIIDRENERVRKEQEEKENGIKAEQKKIEDEKRAIELQKMKEEEARQREFQMEAARKESAEKERLRIIEAQKQAVILEAEKLAQSSDKAKFKTVAATLSSIRIPEMKSKKAQKLHVEVRQMIDKIIEHINTNI